MPTPWTFSPDGNGAWCFLSRDRGAVIGVIVAVLLMQVALPSTLAQNGGAYNLTWNMLDGGRATFATSGTYSLGGTIGQPDAGTLSGGV